MGSALKILLTGGSSFTGYWFADRLTRAGHEVVATLRSAPEDYTGVRGERVRRLRELCRCEAGLAFGDDGFLRLIGGGRWDAICHHGADVTDYKSPDFDYVRALANNTHRAGEVLGALRETGCRSVVLTGSVFENDEGAGSEGLPAFSRYGLSKALTYQAFRYTARELGLRLAKFVIPNPFGPLEEPRFTAYLIRCWRAGEVARVNTPAYVRDNIHVSLLARAYAAFVEAAADGDRGEITAHPSGYPESQGAFAERFAREMRPRLGLACELELATQAEFAEPRVRINTDLLDAEALGWREERAWDELAEYYSKPGGVA